MSSSKIDSMDRSGNKIIVNFESLDTFSNKIIDESKNLNNIVSELLLLTEDMDKFFNTPTANKMQEALIMFLKETQTKCNNLNSVGEQVGKFKKAYEDARNNTNQAIGA